MNQSLMDIEIKRVIGSGCFGIVLEVQYKNSNKKCALKRIQKSGNQLSREYQILQKIQGLDNVVQMEVIKGQIQRFFYTRHESGTKLIQNIIFEYLESNLQNLIEEANKSKTIIKESLIKKYVYQLLNGLKNIHKHNIAHRDLKPENVLLSDKGQVKICDFGSSKILDNNGKNTPYIVSRYYRAPELILCMTKYSTAIDVWAAGCILAQLHTLTPFFKGKTQGEQLFAIVRRMGKFSKSDKSFFRQNVSYDINILSPLDHEQKEDLNQTFKMSKDRTNLIDLLQLMLKYNPNQRITAQEALSHSYFNDVRLDKSDLQKTIKK